MELPENYYLKNFLELTSFVSRCYSELLLPEETHWFKSVCSLSEPAQRLYIRLLGRRGDTYRVGKLRYDEIVDISEAIVELASSALASVEAPMDLITLSGLFTKSELVKNLGISTASLPRADIVTQCLEGDVEKNTRLLQQADQWVTIQGRELFEVFRLCFFGNLHQDLSEFVLTDLGKQRFEPYLITRTSRAFQTRAQLDAQIEYYKCAQEYEHIDCSDKALLLELDKALPAIPAEEVDPHLVRRVDRLRNRIARQLERIDAATAAFSLYARSNRPPSRERRVRILNQLERYEDARLLCQQMATAPVADEELQFAELFLPKLHKALGMSVKKIPVFRPNTTKLTLKPGDSRVEIVARDFYAQFGECFYVENALVNGVLGLFIWDIIFLPMPNVFFNPFQSSPADFYQTSFRIARQKELRARWSLLEDDVAFGAQVWESFEAKQGIANPLVNWGWLSDELLRLALMRIPAAHFRILFDRILNDLANNSSGLPDLILFDRKGGYEFIEIKGPGDAVQKNQKRWMQHFTQHRIPYRVVQVRWSSAPH